MANGIQIVPWDHLWILLPSCIIQLEFCSLVGVLYFNVLNTNKTTLGKLQVLMAFQENRATFPRLGEQHTQITSGPMTSAPFVDHVV